RTNSAVSLLHFDIDHFKLFNDTYGHEAGDAVVQAVGASMLTLFRGSDVPCRYGGEEVTVVLPHCSLASAVARAHELRERLAALHISRNHMELPPPTISCGVASFPEHSLGAETLVGVADRALYAAKAAGRNTVVRGSIVLGDSAK